MGKKKNEQKRLAAERAAARASASETGQTLVPAVPQEVVQPGVPPQEPQNVPPPQDASEVQPQGAVGQREPSPSFSMSSMTSSLPPTPVRDPSSGKLNKKDTRAHAEDTFRWEERGLGTDPPSGHTQPLGSHRKPFASAQDRKKNVGKEGRPIKLTVNHFGMKIARKEPIHHYDVKMVKMITKKASGKEEIAFKKSETDMAVQVLQQLAKEHSKVFGSIIQKHYAYDGVTNMYTCDKIDFPNSSVKFNQEIVFKEEDGQELKVKVTLTYAGDLPIKEAVEQYERSGASKKWGPTGGGGKGKSPSPTPGEQPQQQHQVALTAINIIFGMAVKLNASFMTFGRRHFSVNSGVTGLGQGKSLWTGTFVSARLGWNIKLNVDMANRPGYERMKLWDFICEFLERPRYGDKPSVRPKPDGPELKEKFNRDKLSRELKGLKIRFTRPNDGGIRKYWANGLKGNAKEMKFKLENGKTSSVYDYFKTEYKYEIKHPNLPLLWIGSRKKTMYWPIECCEIEKQPAPKEKSLTENQAAAMIRKTAMKPQDRKQHILKSLDQVNKSYKDDAFTKAFGISIDSKLTDITGRVLNAPVLAYGPQGNRTPVQADRGQWRMPRATFVKGETLNHWGIMVIEDPHRPIRGLAQALPKFISMVVNDARQCGLRINPPVNLNQPIKAKLKDLRAIEHGFQELHCIIAKSGPPQLIMAICPEKGNHYDGIKRLGDCEYRMPTQFVLSKNVTKEPISPQTVHNIVIKINSKLGGVNQMLATQSSPKWLEKPAMVVGADVTHPDPGSQGQKPSIAAVCASVDPEVGTFNTEVRLQDAAQSVEEIIKLREMMSSLLLKFFQRNNGRKPLKIIFYRDGVSEGQFDMVLVKEISAIQQACFDLEPGYEPEITFVVAQKRHNTRLFPENVKDTVGKAGNIPPGTVVDTEITHPVETNFFLASHEGIQGTTRPTGYHLLWDDSNFTHDEIQKLTYYLCHLYSRCERSVSYPAPTYYAHLAAFRARAHHNALLEKGLGDDKAEREKIEKLSVQNYFV